MKKRAAGHKKRAPKTNPAPSPREKSAALDDYVRKHWGDQGTFEKIEAAVVDVRHGTLVIMGTLESVTYSTRKGAEDGGKLTDYVHAFERTLPLLAYHLCEKGKRCPEHGKLVIAGGTYKVESRGIVG